MRFSTTLVAALTTLALAAPAPAPVNAIVNGDKLKNIQHLGKRDLEKISQEKVIVSGDQLSKEA